MAYACGKVSGIIVNIQIQQHSVCLPHRFLQAVADRVSAAYGFQIEQFINAFARENKIGGTSTFGIGQNIDLVTAGCSFACRIEQIFEVFACSATRGVNIGFNKLKISKSCYEFELPDKFTAMQIVQFGKFSGNVVVVRHFSKSNIGYYVALRQKFCARQRQR